MCSGIAIPENMVNSRKLNDGLLARVNFPLYSVEMLTSRHVLVAGGGGSSKTGVANGFVSGFLFSKFFNNYPNAIKSMLNKPYFCAV